MTPRPAGPGRPDPVRAAALWLGGIASVAFAGISMSLALRAPMTTDFAGFDAVVHAATAHLGCVYSRPVQLAGARLVPGLAAPATPQRLPWHFNEPLALAFLVYPLVHLPLIQALWVWELASLAALGAAAAALWRQRGPAGPLLALAAITSMLFNQIANTNLALAQNDAFLLLIFLIGLVLLRAGHEFGAGALFGIVALKPQLVFLVLLFLVFQRRWRVVAGMCASAAAAWSASLAAVGPSCAAHWLHTASAIGELQVGVGLPVSLAVLTGTVLPSEVLFGVLCLGAAALLWHLRRAGTELGIALALACALVVGVHVLGYDMLFLVPLGMVLARRFPWPVFVAGWLLTAALVTDFLTKWDNRPLHLAEFVPLAVLAAAAASQCSRLAGWTTGHLGKADAPSRPSRSAR